MNDDYIVWAIVILAVGWILICAILGLSALVQIL